MRSGIIQIDSFMSKWVLIASAITSLISHAHRCMAVLGFLYVLSSFSGLSPSLVGGFSCLCAFMGVGATFMSAQMVKKLGILKVGFSSLDLLYSSPESPKI